MAYDEVSFDFSFDAVLIPIDDFDGVFFFGRDAMGCGHHPVWRDNDSTAATEGDAEVAPGLERVFEKVGVHNFERSGFRP